MSYQRLYPQRINWEDEPSLATPINQVNLNKMDSALFGIDGRVVELDENKVGKNDTFNTSRNGVVPKPTQADITNEKVLRADGVWVEQSGGGGGGGGHIYVDKDDEQMPPRGKAKFTGGLNLTDDSENNRTIVDDNYEIIPWATWQGYSDAQKAEHPNAIITNAPDCDGDIEITNWIELYTNDDYTSEFQSKNITLSSDDYDFLYIDPLYATTNFRRLPSIIIPKGQNGQIAVPTSTGNGVGTFWRNFTRVSDTEYTIGDCALKDMTASAVVNNNLLIPYKIYGFKKKLTAKIKAIAHDVSTDASKCMLDENTSVADVLNATTANTKQSLGNISTYTPTKDGYLKVATNNSTSNAFVYIADATSGMVLAVCTGFNANTGCFCSTQVKKNKQYNFYSNASATISAEFLPIE